jgi:hypothetical protein
MMYLEIVQDIHLIETAYCRFLCRADRASAGAARRLPLLLLAFNGTLT